MFLELSKIKIKKYEDLTMENLQIMLNDFEVTTEEELYTLLTEDNWIVHCSLCGEEISLLNCDFVNRDPVCKGKCKNEKKEFSG